MVIKKDGSREAFNRDKLLSGIIKACEKRPVTLAEMERVADDIERGLNNLMEKEVKSSFIGELVMEKLKELGVSFYDIDVAELQAAYQAKAAEKGFTFDADWQAAVDEAVASVA